jgi:hypothetical protein
MTAIRVIRRHTAVRVSPRGRETRTDLALCAESGEPGRWRLAALSPDGDGEQPAARAHSAWRLLGEKARPVLGGGGLLVEAGHTRTEVVCDGRTVLTHGRAYLLARDGDHVLHLGGGPLPEDVLPWARAAGPEEIRADAPVILGPSALLALTAAAREEGDGGTTPARVTPPVPSPYPPHDLPLPPLPPGAGGGRAAAELHQARELLGDPALWPVPHGAFGEFTAAVPQDVDAGPVPVAAAPPRALVIDSLSPRGRSSGGGLEWAAAYRVSDSTGTARGTGPLRLRGAPAELLATAEAHCGPRRPGLGRDPIGRAFYRLVPAVITSLNAGQALAR